LLSAPAFEGVCFLRAIDGFGKVPASHAVVRLK